MNKNFSAVLLAGALLALSGCTASILKWKIFQLPSDEELAAEKAADIAAAVARLHEPMHTGFFGQDAEVKRVNAAWDLGHDLEAYGAVPELALALQDADPDVRANAAISLLNMRDHAAAAVPSLRTALTDRFTGVRLTAARTLWLMHAASTDLFPVLDGLMNGSYLRDAVEAADLAMDIGREPQEVVPTLMRGMTGGEAERVLANLEAREDMDIAYLPLLLKGAKSSAEEVRAKSIHLLATPIYASPTVTAILRNAVADRSDVVHLEAIGALVYGGDGQDEVGRIAGVDDGTADVTMAMLLELSHEKWNPAARRLALEDLGESKSTAPEVLDALTVGLKDGNADVRLQAAESMALLGKRAEPAKAILLSIWGEGQELSRKNGGDLDNDDLFYYQAIGQALQRMGVDPPS